ncbi:MAG: hypothetical protein M1832_003869 [Thelocarpon impressellum]|nr:MAG: hypothetical protein M1832_003869 [Thelocarpon impressellum]
MPRGRVAKTEGWQQVDDDAVSSQPSPSMASKKRSFSTHSAVSAGNTSAKYEYADTEVDLTPSTKRTRGTNWPPSKPFNDATVHAQRRTLSHRRSDVSISPRNASRGEPGTPARPSKFVEGSMNDRVSNMPPSQYIKEEEDLERWMEDTANGVRGGFMRHSNLSSAPSNAARSSGIFRFGKSLAAAFNPTHIWDGVSNIWRKESDDHPQRDVMRERKERADRYYDEQRRAGHVNGGKVHIPSSVPYERTARGPPPAIKRDSGVDVGGYRSSDDRKRDGRVFDDAELLMPPPPARMGRSRSPAGVRTPNKAPAKLKKPSLANLKTKSKSEVSLPSTARAASTASESRVAEAPREPAAALAVRKKPSKRELQKQQRLAKKVSDLESKLDAARREYEKVVVDAPPVPPLPVEAQAPPPKASSTPGAPSSLPSDRPPVSGADGADDVPIVETRAVRSRGKVSKPAPATKKRKSSGDDIKVEVEEPATPAKNRGRGKKAQKLSRAVDDLDGLTEPRVPESASSLDKTVSELTAETAFLGRPRPTSPTKASRIPRRSVSPPAALIYSKPARRRAEVESGAVSATPDDASVPALPKMPRGIERIVRLASGEADPATGGDARRSSGREEHEQEGFEWPPDVF